MTDKQVQQTKEPVYYMHNATSEVDTEEFWRDNCEEWENFDEYVLDENVCIAHSKIIGAKEN